MPGGEAFDHPQLSSHCFPGSPAAAAGHNVEGAGAAAPCMVQQLPLHPCPCPHAPQTWLSLGAALGSLLMSWCTCLVALVRRALSLPLQHHANV